MNCGVASEQLILRLISIRIEEFARICVVVGSVDMMAGTVALLDAMMFITEVRTVVRGMVVVTAAAVAAVATTGACSTCCCGHRPL